MKLLWAFFITIVLIISSVWQTSDTAAARLNPSQHPGPRTVHCLLYDEQRRQVILLGGYLWASPRNQLETTELWSWDGKAWERILGSELRARTLNAAIYDSHRKRIVSFWGAGAIKEQQWEWDDKSWQQSVDARPDDRIHPAMMYDAGRRKIVMYGGTISQSTNAGTPQRWSYPTDTWEEQAGKWTQRATQGPPGRAITCGAIVYDSKRKQILLFGGLGATPGAGQTQAIYNDTWLWNGSDWRKASDTGPPPRFAHSLTFDRCVGIILLYGGTDFTRQFGDMWQWDGQQWKEIQLTGITPGKRSNHAIAYDAARNKTVLYGGSDGAKTLDDTWEWDSERWRQIK